MDTLGRYWPLIAALLTALGTAITAATAAGPSFNLTTFLVALCGAIVASVGGLFAPKPGAPTREDVDAMTQAAYERGRRDSDRPPAFEPLVLDDEEES